MIEGAGLHIYREENGMPAAVPDPETPCSGTETPHVLNRLGADDNGRETLSDVQ